MATSSSDGLYEWNSDDDKPLQSPTAEVSDHTLVHNSPAPSKRGAPLRSSPICFLDLNSFVCLSPRFSDRTSRPHTRSKPGAVVESNNTLPNFPRKRKSMDAQREDEPSRQDRERERKRKVRLDPHDQSIFDCTCLLWKVGFTMFRLSTSRTLSRQM